MAISNKTRHNARIFAMQALYQWHIAGGDIPALLAQYMTNNVRHKVDWDFFQDLVRGCAAQLSDLDTLLSPLTDRPFAEVNPVELAILRAATYELKNRLDVPYKVVINEYIDLAHQYGAEEGHKFVNGVLDKLARSLRRIEVDAHS
jgi:N utilization substance protein B